MLTRSSISVRRRIAAAAAVLVLVSVGGVAAWAAQPAREVPAAMSETAGSHTRLREIFATHIGKTEFFIAFETLEPDSQMAPREDVTLVTPIRP